MKTFRHPAPDAPAEPVTGVRERAKLTREEFAELVLVRGLLCELRPGDTRDPAGPLSWSPMVHEPAHTEPPLGTLARRIRVQTSVGPSDGPKDAFAAAAPLATATVADERIRRIAADGGEQPARALTWLQRAGTVADGLPALYAAAGEALADDARRARWAARPGAVADEQRRLRGRETVLYAMRWWGGERPVCVANFGDCNARHASGRVCVEAGARCVRPEKARAKARAKGSRCRRVDG